MLPGELLEAVAALASKGYQVELKEETPHIFVLFHNFQLPKGIYNKSHTELFVFTTPEYPNAGFDMFWTDPDLTLANGTAPRGAEAMEPHLGKTWRRFSWHLNRAWNPAVDDLLSYLSCVEERLMRG
jgi:hypothetical protein